MRSVGVGEGGTGFEPVILRWNSSLHAGRVSPYVELAGGGVRTNSNLPIGNTSDFNFTTRGGGGILINRTPRHAIDVGVRCLISPTQILVWIIQSSTESR